jgi:hypothetical protein
LLRAVTLEGIATELELPPKTKLEDDVVDRFVAVPAIAGPLRVRVYAPTVNVPEVSVRVPPTVTSPLMVIPFERLMVRLFSVTAGSDVVVPEAKVMLEDAPPVSEPEVTVITPPNVRV